MTPEERFERHIWYVLQKIKDIELYAEDKKSLRYLVSFDRQNMIDKQVPPPDREIAIFKKLGSEFGVIKISFEEDSTDNQLDRIKRRIEEFANTIEDEAEAIAPSPTIKRIRLFSFEILRPNFDKFYSPYQKEFEGSTTTREVKKTKNQSEKINKIELVRHEPNTGKLKLVVNENYRSPVEVGFGKYWSKLYELADEGKIAKNKPFFDYFNSNPNNPLYTKLGYKITQILKFDGGVLIKSNIQIKIIENKTITQRKNKETT